MADSGALRTRRSRKHSAGDHTLCKDPERCTRADEPAAPERASSGRTVEAQALWDALSAELVLGPIERVLLSEACACMDRLALLRTRETEVAMTEARHQATALKGLLAEIRRGAAGAGTKPGAKAPSASSNTPPADDGAEDEEGVVHDDFASRLAARRAAATG